MKKFFKYSLIVTLCAALVSLTGCQEQELDVNPLGGGFSFSGMAPNPVMRGGELRIYGSGLSAVKAVRFAGDVTVTEFVDLAKGSKLDTLKLIVPLEGPEVGKVVLVNKDGSEKASFSDLSFSEPIEVSSISPATVLSGDILTIQGEYLNVVKEVFFSGDNSFTTDFESQSRHELKVKVPANAISGPVILSDVDEVQDGNTIPNHIYTSDLTVGDPTVVKAEKATYKSGDVIKVFGEHLDMIKNVALPQVAEVEFSVSATADTIVFNLPPKASDGSITLTSYAGVEFDAGEIETVSVSELNVKTLAADNRYKAGCDIEITGSDLDLVTAVAFEGAEATWYMSGKDTIRTVLPASAKDGVVTVTLESGKKAYSDAIEVVKPVVTGVDITTATAAKDVVKVSGTDLDLVTSAKIGNKTQSFIDCSFVLKDGEAGASYLEVSIPEQAYSGPITLTADSGYETVTEDITVVYNMALSITYDSPSYQLGKPISFTGSKLLQIESIKIKGKKVMSYGKRADDAVSFALPDGIGPGVYRMEITLIDGSSLTWPVPFEVTAPYTESFVFEGSQDLGSWTINWELKPSGALADLGAKEGDILRIYGTPTADYWQVQMFDGHWGAMDLGLGNGNNVNAGIYDLSAGYIAIELDADRATKLTTLTDWGYYGILQGENFIVTGISLVQFGAVEKRTTIWEGSTTVTWGGGALSALSWGGYDWSTVKAGTKLAATYTIDDPEGVIRFGNGSWASLPSLAGLATDGNIPLSGTGYEFELTDADLEQLVNAGGLVVCGTGFTLTEIALVTSEGAGPQETAIWEGSSTVTWASGAVTDLSWGGYDWSTVSAGTILCAHYTIDDSEGVIRFGNGSWAAIPSTAGFAADGNLPVQEGGHEIELTQADIDEMVANGGLVVCGTGFTITQIGLKK